MSNDKHKIKVSLDTGAEPPVTVSPNELKLKHKGTHKVIWKPADGTTKFVFHSLTIDCTTVTNPESGKKPGKTSPFSEIGVSDEEITLKDKVAAKTKDFSDFPYELIVKVDDKEYSSKKGEKDPKLDGGTPKIRNQN